MTREIRLPIYLFEKDDNTFRKLLFYKELSFCEEFDVVYEPIYEAWDSDGGHLVLTWDRRKRAPIASIDMDMDISGLEAAVAQFCAAMRKARKGVFWENMVRPEEMEMVVQEVKLRRQGQGNGGQPPIIDP